MKPGFWAGVGLVLLGLVVFSPLFEADFTSRDDDHTVAKNPAMLGPIGDVAWFWSNLSHPVGDIYIPATQTLWYGIARFARESPGAGTSRLSAGPFHVANVLIHLISGCLVFGLIRRLVSTLPAAALGAAVFLVHPLQVEAVGWVSGLKDVLSGALVLLSLYAFLWYSEKAALPPAEDKDASRARWGWYALATGAFALAMLAKPAAVVTPLLAMILSVGAIILQSREKAVDADRPSRRSIPTKIFLPLLPWFAMTIPIALEGRRVQPATIVPDVALWARPLVAGDALCFYMWKLFVPSSLAADYARTPASIMQSGTIYWTWVVPAIVLGLAVAYRRRWPALLLAVLLFFAAPLPVLGLVKFVYQFFSTVSDHYVYVAMLGPAIAVAAVFERFGTKPLMRWGSVVVLGTLCVLTFVQSGYWKTDFDLTGHIVDVTPRSLLGQVHLGRLYAEQGMNMESVQHYEQAVAIAPADRVARQALGNMYMLQNRNAEAAEQFRVALGAAPDDAGMLMNLGVVLARQKQFTAARASFDRALQIEPDNAQIHVDVAILLSEQNDWAGAAEEYRRALAIDPNSKPAKAGLEGIRARPPG